MGAVICIFQMVLPKAELDLFVWAVGKTAPDWRWEDRAESLLLVLEL